MEPELKDFGESNRLLETLDESPRYHGDGGGSELSKDEHSLLILDSSVSTGSDPAPCSFSEPTEELEETYAAYVRKDVYGRGGLPLPEKVLIGLALGTLVPLRVMVGMSISAIYYLICRVCTLFTDDDQEDYAHMVWWREVLVRCGRFLSRAMMFNLGFYSICVVAEKIQEVHQNKPAPLMLLFPEGTTTNGGSVLPFKTGAFLAKVPVRPVIIRYPYTRFSPAWDTISGVHHLILLLSQFVNHIEVIRLPGYNPSQQEKEDPKPYANNVRKLIASEGGMILSDIGLAEKRVYHATLNGSCGSNAGSNTKVCEHKLTKNRS